MFWYQFSDITGYPVTQFNSDTIWSDHKSHRLKEKFSTKLPETQMAPANLRSHPSSGQPAINSRIPMMSGFIRLQNDLENMLKVLYLQWQFYDKEHNSGRATWKRQGLGGYWELSNHISPVDHPPSASASSSQGILESTKREAQTWAIQSLGSYYIIGHIIEITMSFWCAQFLLWNCLRPTLSHMTRINFCSRKGFVMNDMLWNPRALEVLCQKM